MKDKAFVGASLLAAVVASLCCILPIVFALGGFAVIGASAFFESLRPYFLLATFALLGAGFYLAYRKPEEACEPESACARPQVNRLGRIGLWIATVLVIAFAAFPYYSGAVADRLLPEGSAKVSATDSTARIRIPGMTCAACAVSVKKGLERTHGVKRAEVSVEKGLAVVIYDDSQVNERQLRDAINRTGFKAEPAKEDK